MKIYFLRHGQTDYNIQNRCNSDPAVPVRLNATGIDQASEAAERLRSAPLERIVVSPLPRTQQTAAIVNRYHHVPVTIHPDLADLRTGCEGRPSEEHLCAIADDPLYTKPPGGESLAEHWSRIMHFLEWLRCQPERFILVVAHEETLRAVAGELRGLAFEQTRAIPVHNAELMEFELGPLDNLPTSPY